MNNYDVVREKIAVGLSQFLSKDDMNKALAVFDLSMHGYEINVSETGLVVYDGNATEQMVEFYIKAQKIRNFRDQTLNEHRRTLNRFFRIVGKAPMDVEHNDIYTYKYYLMDKGVSAPAINTYLSQISAFYGWAIKRGICTTNPVESDDKSKCAPTEKLPLSDAEVDIIREKLNSDAFSIALFEFMLSTGLRREEVIKTKKSDICYDRQDDFGNVPILVPDGKGGKGRFTFISKSAMKLIEDYLKTRTDSYEELFLNSKGKPLSTKALNERFEYFSELTGIHFTPHTLRRTFATNSVQRGVTINAVSRVMGHASINTTMIYAKDTMETLMEQFEKVM